jgi:ABC-2 type transport system permease protein
MNKLPLLLKREYWEHRGGFLWAPIWITGAILILTVLGIISAEVFRSNAHVQIGFSLDELRRSISADDIAKAANGLDIVQLVFVGVASVGLFFVTFFYLLGALYDDRRDRSVLFWKSLPISDTETVASKALTAMLVMPVIVLAVATLAYVAFLVLVSIWIGAHGLNPLPALLGSHPIGMLLRLIAIVPVSALWALPTVGWLLFWSAYVRSKPFLWAVLLPVVALIANAWLGALGAPHFGGNLHLASILGRLLFSVMPGSWAGADGISIGNEHVTFNMNDDHIVSSLDPSHIYGLLATPNLWIGVVGGLVLLACAVQLRRRRVETSV